MYFVPKIIMIGAAVFQREGTLAVVRIGCKVAGA